MYKEKQHFFFEKRICVTEQVACVLSLRSHNMPFKSVDDRRAYQRYYYHLQKKLKGPRKRTPEQRERQRAAQRKYDRKRCKRPAWRLRNALRSRVRHALNSAKYGKGAVKSGRTFDLLGCNALQLRAHLQSMFAAGMTWENHGKWHIDHIMPCASFDLAQASEQATCFHYTNLQPLWAADNLKKGASIPTR